MTLPRRGVLVLAALGAGAALLAASSVVWLRAQVPTVISSTEASVTGGAAAPAVPALALVCLAAAGALAIGRRWAATVAAVVLAAAGAAAVAGTVAVLADPEPPLLAAAARVSGVRAIDGPAVVTAGPYVTAALGLVVVLLGVLSVLGARSWQQGGRRFEEAPAGGDRPAGTPATPEPRAAGGPVAERDRAMDDWDALGRGEDPSEPSPG